MECWDDDDELQGFDSLNLRSVSTTTANTSLSNRGSHHRDSISSRFSTKSEFDDESDWQLLLPTGDEKSAQSAIADAKNKGVPIPANVPSSALVGGTIKRLGGKKIKKIIGEEWGDGLELPKAGNGGLRLKLGSRMEFPDAIGNVDVVSPTKASSAQPKSGNSFMERLKMGGSAALDKFKDTADDDFDDVPTIKVARGRMPMPIPNFSQQNTTPQKKQPLTENFEDDLELPADGELKLSAR